MGRKAIEDVDDDRAWCHQCGHKHDKAEVRYCTTCTLRYGYACLARFYPNDTEPLQTWKCPRCRDKCVCRYCTNKKRHQKALQDPAAEMDAMKKKEQESQATILSLQATLANVESQKLLLEKEREFLREELLTVERKEHDKKIIANMLDALSKCLQTSVWRPFLSLCCYFSSLTTLRHYANDTEPLQTWKGPRCRDKCVCRRCDKKRHPCEDPPPQQEQQVSDYFTGGSADFSGILTSLPKPGGGDYGKFYSLPALNDRRIEKLPYTIRILLESAIRNCDNFQVTKEDVQLILDWAKTAPNFVEIPFKAARVLLQGLYWCVSSGGPRFHAGCSEESWQRLQQNKSFGSRGYSGRSFG